MILCPWTSLRRVDLIGLSTSTLCTMLNTSPGPQALPLEGLLGCEQHELNHNYLCWDLDQDLKSEFGHVA